MAEQILSRQEILFGPNRITPFMSQVALNFGAEVKDCTTFGDSTRRFVPGEKTLGASMQGFFQQAPVDADLYNAVAAQSQLVTITEVDGTEGNGAYQFQAISTEYGNEGQVGELFKFSVNAAASGSDLLAGTIMLNRTNATASITGTARLLGASPAGKKVYLGYHLLGLTGTTPTVTLSLKSGTTAGGATTQRIATSALSAPGSGLISNASVFTDTYWRLDATLAGTTPGVTLLACVAIQ